MTFGPNLFNQIVAQYFNFTFCFLSNGSPVCPCNLTNSWPSFSFMLMGVEVYLDPAQYKQLFSQTGLCSANIASGNTPNNMVVFGLPFFRVYTISFAKTNSKVGFYGRSKPVYIIDGNNPIVGYFLLLQYILCGMTAGFSIVGIVMSVVNYKKIKNMRDNNR